MGASAVVLRDALGHKTMAMTGRYIAHQTDPVRELAEQIGDKFKACGNSSKTKVGLELGTYANARKARLNESEGKSNVHA